MRALVLMFLLLASQMAVGQNLFNERIRKVSSKKTSVYLDKGIFHTGAQKSKSTLKAIRHRYRKKERLERIVFDFKTKDIPRIYGHISKGERKLYIDVFETDLDKDFGTFGNSKLVKSIDFFPIQKKMLSIEIVFKEAVSIDVFHLKDHARFVVDAKKN